MKHGYRGPGPLGWFDRYSEHQARQRAAHRAGQQRHEYADDVTSGVHDAGGLATPVDLDVAGMRDGTFYLGADEEGNALFSSTTGSLSSVGSPGIGKGSTVSQPNQAWLGNDYSLVVLDVGHEGYRVCAGYRGEVLGQRVLANNPSGAYEIGNVNLDFIAHIREAGRRGNFKLVERRAREFKYVLVPEEKDHGDTKWILEAARGIVQWLLVWTALERSDLCNLPSIYDLASMEPRALLKFVLENTQLEYVQRRCAGLVADLETGADKQLHWKLEKLQTVLEPYQRGTELGDALSGPAFNPAILRERPTTLYLGVAESSLDAQANYLACMITSLVDQLADADGPQKILFMLEEASQLPKMDLPRWIRTYRKRNIQFWMFWQSLSSIEAVYGKAGKTDLLDNCDVIQHLSVADSETAKRLSERAGTRTIFGRSMNQGADGRSASDSMSEQRQSLLPVPDILNMPRYAQLLEIKGLKLIKGLRFPWWEIDPFAERLKHFSEMEDQPRYRRGDDASSEGDGGRGHD